MVLNIKKVILPLFLISVLFNFYLLLKSTDNLSFKKDAFCAEFKKQASERIRTYYANTDVVNIYPDEIFYSESKGSCVALWSNTERNPAQNGRSTTKVIFNPVTNYELFSESLVYFDDKELEKRLDLINTNTESRKRYEEMLRELRN